MDIWQAHSKGVPSYPTWNRLGELNPDVVLIFRGIDHFQRNGFMAALMEVFPGSALLGCSIAGEILCEGTADGRVVFTTLKFQHPAFRTISAPLDRTEDSRTSGQRLGEQLNAPFEGLPLHGVLLLGLCVGVNDSAIIQGITDILGQGVSVCGALAGDGGASIRTVTLCGDTIFDRQVRALGLCGDGIEWRTASAEGWMPFGPLCRIRRTRNNLFYELDAKPALDVYRRDLRDGAKELPEAGLLFPIDIREDEHHETGLIGTSLGVDETSRSLVMEGTCRKEAWPDSGMWMPAAWLQAHAMRLKPPSALGRLQRCSKAAASWRGSIPTAMSAPRATFGQQAAQPNHDRHTLERTHLICPRGH